MFWENYGPFAIGEFDNIPYVNTVRYKVTILKKNYNFRYNPLLGYTDPVASLTFAKDPVVIRTLNDDVFGIKGSEAVLNILNKDSTLPLATFYAEEEDEFKVTIEATYLDSGSVSQTKTIFIGYLVQEDSSEILTDITHEIRLTFTDNLGTLKNLSFGDAAKISPTSAANLRQFPANLSAVPEGVSTSGYIQLNTFPTLGSPLVGDYVFLNDSPIGDVAFTIVKIEDISGVRRIYVREKIQAFSNVNVTIAYLTGNNPYLRLKLSEIIRICLHGTNLLLNFKFGNQSYAQTETQSIPYPLDLQIDGRTFLSGEDNWKSCYDVLQEICMRFQASLYQSDGVWYMTRWHELRYTNNQIIHTDYNQYIVNQFTTSQYAPNTIGQVEAGMEESILRPYNYYKETFKYGDQNQLLFNANFEFVGAKFPSDIAFIVVDGVNCRVNEYDAVGFNTFGSATTTFTSRIRVLRRLTGSQDEVERYLVIKYTGAIGSSVWINAFKSNNIEVNKGDRLKISFAWRNNSDTGRSTEEQLIHVRYTNSTNDYYYIGNAQIANQQQEIWPALSGNLILSREITHTQWNDYTIETEVIPTTGVIQIFFGVSVFNSNNERHYKNLKVEVINQVSANASLKGHEHKGFINKVVKNNENQDITIDSTLKNSIYGTLFSSQFTNLVQNRVFTFKDGNPSVWEGNFGELTTKQMMDWRYIQRIKLEGKLLGIYKASFEWLTLHQALIFSLKSGKYFIFGKAVYNLKEDFIEATLYEMWKQSEGGPPVGIGANDQLDYDFKFLY